MMMFMGRSYIRLRAKASYFEEQVKNAAKFLNIADQLKP